MCSHCPGDYEDPDATQPEVMEIDVRETRINVGVIAVVIGIGGAIWGWGLAYVYPWIHRFLQ